MEHLSMLILGVIQGAAEFLPISSSGHLALAKMLLKDNADVAAFSAMPLALDILLHLATLAAVFIFFRKQLLEAFVGGWRLLLAVFRGSAKTCLAEDDGANTALCVIVATIPTAILGLLIKDAAEQAGTSPFALGIIFLFCAGLLLFSRFKQGGDQRLSLRFALIIGLAQGVAVLPGLSRSGTTIAVALALGLVRKDAFTFSFLLSVPAILGAAVLELDWRQFTAGEHAAAYITGVGAAFLVGLGSLYLISRVVDKGRLWWFAPYVASVGTACLVVGIL
jgi:undecaprenyl-diphosphatase